MDQTRAEELVRRLEREIEKVTLLRGLTRQELRGFIEFLADRQSTGPIADRLPAQPDPAAARKIVDSADILRRTPDMPALAPIVAVEHHLKQDLSGYPEKIGNRQRNLCTMIVSIADVFDALRSPRPYPKGLATDRIGNIEHLGAVVEAVDAEPLAIDPLTYL